MSLLRNLLVRDLHVKYRSSTMGYCWSLINPVLYIAIYAFVFRYILQIQASGKHNYVALLITGFIFWNFISACISTSANTVVYNAHLIQKVNFPLIITVISNHIFLLFEHLLSYPFLAFTLFVLFDIPLTTNLIWFPAIFLLLNLFSFGISLLLATSTVFYRDITHFITIGVQVLFWLTPIVYPISSVPQRFMFYIKLTPATPFIRCVQNILCKGTAPPPISFLQASVYAGLAIVVGLFVFYQYHRQFAHEV